MKNEDENISFASLNEAEIMKEAENFYKSIYGGAVGAGKTRMMHEELKNRLNIETKDGGNGRRSNRPPSIDGWFLEE